MSRLSSPLWGTVHSEAGELALVLVAGEGSEEVSDSTCVVVLSLGQERSRGQGRLDAWSARALPTKWS